MKLNLGIQSNLDGFILLNKICTCLNHTFAIGLDQRHQLQRGYLADECMTLCLRYLHSIETKFNYPHRKYENQVKNHGSLSIFNPPGRRLGSQRVRTIEKHELDEAHIYILKNYDELQPFIE